MGDQGSPDELIISGVKAGTLLELTLAYFGSQRLQRGENENSTVKVV